MEVCALHLRRDELGAPLQQAQRRERLARQAEQRPAARAQHLLIQKYGWQKKLINFFARLAGRKSVVISIHLS